MRRHGAGVGDEHLLPAREDGDPRPGRQPQLADLDAGQPRGRLDLEAQQDGVEPVEGGEADRHLVHEAALLLPAGLAAAADRQPDGEADRGGDEGDGHRDLEAA